MRNGNPRTSATVEVLAVVVEVPQPTSAGQSRATGEGAASGAFRPYRTDRVGPIDTFDGEAARVVRGAIPYPVPLTTDEAAGCDWAYLFVSICGWMCVLLLRWGS